MHKKIYELNSTLSVEFQKFTRYALFLFVDWLYFYQMYQPVEVWGFL